jgi:hypothetical protein
VRRQQGSILKQPGRNRFETVIASASEAKSIEPRKEWIASRKDGLLRRK